MSQSLSPSGWSCSDLAENGIVHRGARLEERVLLDADGEEYREYCRSVPMLFPRPWRSFDSGSSEPDATADELQTGASSVGRRSSGTVSWPSC